MKVTYFFVFTIATIIAFFYDKIKLSSTMQEAEAEEKDKHSKPSFIEDIFLFCCPVGLLVCLLCWIFSSNVIKIEDNYKHTENDYFFFYKDFNNNIHVVIPFTNYISNESNERLINSPVCYGSRDSNDYENEYFEKYEFKRIKNKPTYFFETPSSSIRIKGSGAVRYLLTTEK